MLFKEIKAVYFETHATPVTAPCGQHVELLSVKAGGLYNHPWASKCLETEPRWSTPPTCRCNC
jgi:hypothetical protein